jgi:hypothetical protein
LGAAFRGSLEQVHQADDVDAGVERGLVDRHADVDLGGVMVDRIELACGRQLSCLGRSNVGPHESRGLRHVVLVAPGQIVQDDHFPPLLQIRFRDV